MIHILKFLTPILLFTLSLSGRSDEDSAMFLRNNRFSPIVKATNFTAHAQYDVICAQGSPKTTRVKMLSPHYLVTIKRL